MAPAAEPVSTWLRALEARHLARLTFPEVRRALEVLSRDYVARRPRVASGDTLAGAGKRAAFALFYGPLHFVLVREIVRALGAATPPPREILDLGCGTGAAGAAWSLESGGVPLRGIDRSGFAVEEARFAWRRLGLRGAASRGDLGKAPLPGRGGAVLLAFAVNELDDAAREDLLSRLLTAARDGTRVLVVEPIARGVAPWLDAWGEAFLAIGGRADAWRFRVPLPDLAARLSKASGLDHRELTARSLYLGSRPP